MLVYALSMEAMKPEDARRLRDAARGFGNMACFLGDESAFGFISDSRHALMRQNMADLAEQVKSQTTDPMPTSKLGASIKRLFDDYFWAA